MKVEPKYKIGDNVTVIYFKMSQAKEPIKFVDPYLVDNKITKSVKHISIIDLKITEIVKCMCEPLEINGKHRKEFTYIAEDVQGNKFYSMHPDTSEEDYKDAFDIPNIFSRCLGKPDSTQLDNCDHYVMSELQRIYQGVFNDHDEHAEWHEMEKRHDDAKWHSERAKKANVMLLILDKLTKEHAAN